MVIPANLVDPPVVEWRAAKPLWRHYSGQDEDNFHRPALLRFTSDMFMDEYIALAQQKPQRMGEWCVRKETWRFPAPIPQLEVNSPLAIACEEDETILPPEISAGSLKLFQPAHERYYLVTASLICRIPGLPDKPVIHGDGEVVSFVLRRFMRRDPTKAESTSNPLREFGMVNGLWAPVTPGDKPTLLPEEEEYGLFPTFYDCPRQEGQRRLFAGLLPVAKREQLLNTARAPEKPTASVAGAASSGDQPSEAERIRHLMTVFEIDVATPWREINRVQAVEDRSILASNAELSAGSSERPHFRRAVDRVRDRLQVSSWYVLLDFAYFLKDHLPELWQHIQTNPDASLIPGSIKGRRLWATLQQIKFSYEDDHDAVTLGPLQNKLLGVPQPPLQPPIPSVSMAYALTRVFAVRTDLERTTWEYVDPKMEPLTENEPKPEQPDPDPNSPDPKWPDVKFMLCGRYVSHRIDGIIDALADAFEESPPDPAQRVPAIPLAAQIHAEYADIDEDKYANIPATEDVFVVRCVYKRPKCPPSKQVVVSEPSTEFLLASFFDPDAPARPFRIPMPVDTTPAGLRKFARNTMFVLSDTLACQLGAARDLTFGDLVLSVLPWPFHKDLPDARPDNCKGSASLAIGKLCTLSIPIITICALILLIIIVLLLDVIFKWVPYLIFCLPIPGLKNKNK